MTREFLLWTLLFSVLCVDSFGQSYQHRLSNVFDEEPNLTASNVGDFIVDTNFSNSGSSWEIDWNEALVFERLLQYSNPNNPEQSFDLRIGQGGQIYSFKNNAFGEALPPQWRPSFDESGNNLADPGPSIPVASHHGNWAPWNDEVWQLVGSDQKDLLANKIKTKNIHQAGSYLNNFSHRSSDLTSAPYYSPAVQRYYNEENQSYTSINWGQSENPSYVYDVFSDCDICFEDEFKPSVLFYNRYKNLGEGIIQVDFLIYNYHRTRGIDYWNVPFVGIRNSSLPYAIISNSATDETSYEILNSKPGHPAPGDESSYLPLFSQGTVVRTSGNNTASSGWFAFSTASNGDGPTLSFVTSKSTSNPVNGYGDIRYGTAMNNPLRDVTIFTRRANGGATNPTTGLKPWGIVGGEAIKGRYFIIVDASISAVVEQINTKNLTSYAQIEKISLDSLPENNIHYTFSKQVNGTLSPEETTSSNAQLSLNSLPFTGSYPVYFISTSSEELLTSDPYSITLKPYNGTIKSIELLGFSSMPQENELVSIISGTLTNKDNPVSVYPNPTHHEVTIIGHNLNTNTIHLKNSLGILVPSSAFTTSVNDGEITIDLSRLNHGMYTLQLGSLVIPLMKM